MESRYFIFEKDDQILLRPVREGDTPAPVWDYEEQKNMQPLSCPFHCSRGAKCLYTVFKAFQDIHSSAFNLIAMCEETKQYYIRRARFTNLNLWRKFGCCPDCGASLKPAGVTHITSPSYPGLNYWMIFCDKCQLCSIVTYGGKMFPPAPTAIALDPVTWIEARENRDIEDITRVFSAKTKWRGASGYLADSTLQEESIFYTVAAITVGALRFVFFLIVPEHPANILPVREYMRRGFRLDDQEPEVINLLPPRTVAESLGYAWKPIDLEHYQGISAIQTEVLMPPRTTFDGYKYKQENMRETVRGKVGVWNIPAAETLTMAYGMPADDETNSYIYKKYYGGNVHYLQKVVTLGNFRVELLVPGEKPTTPPQGNTLVEEKVANYIATQSENTLKIKHKYESLRYLMGNCSVRLFHGGYEKILK